MDVKSLIKKVPKTPSVNTTDHHCEKKQSVDKHHKSNDWFLYSYERPLKRFVEQAVSEFTN